jgi:hypothetical protein
MIRGTVGAAVSMPGSEPLPLQTRRVLRGFYFPRH